MHRIASAITGLLLTLMLASVAVATPPTSHKNDEGNIKAVRKAIAALNLIKADFTNPAIDYCGHRATAAAAIDAALAALTSAQTCASPKAEEFEVHKKGKYANERAALKQLKHTRHELQDKDDNFCGNRVAALGAVDAVIAQLQFVVDCNQ